MNIYKKALEKMREDITERVNSAYAEQSNAPESVEETDQIQDRNNKEILVKILEKDTQTLRKIKNAFKKIGDGTYGECENCGCSIEEKRLLAVPLAINCIECQEELDRKK